eukprot:5782326-Pyramimonas_sp.AAC.1
MAAVTTLCDLPTFFSATSNSVLDYVCVPQSMIGAVRVTGALMGKGRRLQLINVAGKRDHVPVFLEITRPSFARQEQQ